MLTTNDDLTIRNATAADASTLVAWWNDGTVMAHAGFPNGVNTTEKVVEASIARNTDDNRCLIAELNGVAIGEMSYRRVDGNAAEIGIKICEISAQNHGLGPKLLQMLIVALFDDYDFEKILLDTNLQNLRAQHVYEKLGFRRLRVNIDAWSDQLGVAQSSVDYEMSKFDYVNSKL